MNSRPAWPESRAVFALLTIIAIAMVCVLMVNPHYPYVQGFPVLEAANTPVSSDDLVFVNVTISGASDVLGAQLELSFNHNVLSLEEVRAGNFFGQDVFFPQESMVVSQGSVSDLFLVRLSEEGVDGSGVLLELVFEAIGSGQGNIELEEVLLANSAAQETSATVSLATQVVSAPSEGTTPVLSNLAPTGTLSVGTTETLLLVTTSVPAFCRFSTTQGASFSSMTVFEETNSTDHEHLLEDLTGSSHTYYVRCRDAQSSLTSSASTISFSIAQQSTPSTPSTPSTGGGGGGGGAAPPPTQTTTNNEQTMPRIEYTHQTNSGVSRVTVDFPSEVSRQAVLRVQPVSVQSAQAPTQTDMGPNTVLYSVGLFTLENTDESPSTISFTTNLDEEWLVSQGLHEDDIVVFGYSQGSWSQLTVSGVSRSNGVVTISATGQAVERYAVGARYDPPEPTTPTTTPPQPSTTTAAPAPTGWSGLRILATILLIFAVTMSVVGGVVLRASKPPEFKL